MRSLLISLLVGLLLGSGVGCSKSGQKQVGVSPSDLNPPIPPLSKGGEGGFPQGQGGAPVSEVLTRFVQRPATPAPGLARGIAPGVDADGYRTEVLGEAYDPCRDKPCPKKDDRETEEDFRYSLPPRK